MYIIISICDFCKVIPQILFRANIISCKYYFVQIFCENILCKYFVRIFCEILISRN